MTISSPFFTVCFFKNSQNDHVPQWKLMSLQLSAILSRQNDENITGLSMTLHMKRKSKISMEEPLYYPTAFIEYYIKLSLGTPAQDLLLFIDTGSSVVWTPCTTNYTFNNSCHGYITVFLPSKSSTVVAVKCADPKCKDLFESSIHNCSEVCPAYGIFDPSLSLIEPNI